MNYKIYLNLAECYNQKLSQVYLKFLLYVQDLFLISLEYNPHKQLIKEQEEEEGAEEEPEK